MNALTAKIITYVLQPLIMPFFGVLILLYFDEYYYLLTSPTQKFYILGFVFLLTFLLPALAAILLKSLGAIGSLMMETREERKLPILITAFIYVIVFFLTGQMHAFEKIRIFILATTLAIILCGFVTNYYKISMHMTGCGGVVGWLLYIGSYSLINVWWLLALCILASGIVGAARLRLKAHTATQVYTGFLLGVGAVYGVSMWLA